MQATPSLACEGSGLGPEGEDEPDSGLDEETGTIVERGLTVKDLQTLVDKRVVNEAENALAAVHDIPETRIDSTLYASFTTGAVPSAEDMDRFLRNGSNAASPRVSRWPSSVACRFHQTVATPLCRYMNVSPNLVCSLDRRDAAAHEEKVWVLESVWSGSTRVGREVRVFDARRIHTHRFPQHWFLSRAC